MAAACASLPSFSLPVLVSVTGSSASRGCLSLKPSRSPAFLLKSQQKAFQPAVKRSCITSASENEVAVTGDDEVEAYPSGEWPANFSMSNYEDLHHHFAPIIFKEEAQPSKILADIMSTNVWTASPESLLSEVQHHFEDISGVPVVDSSLKCVGVLSKKDIAAKTTSASTKVSEIMSFPPVTLTVDKTVQDAAIVMLKEKVHRIPVVNDKDQVVGIVTRTDIFSAMEDLPPTREV
eukprot:TRINITY_DN1505_c0_g1_i1.p1 TRINITY_DN1505_c0_g1~~TRINITY_DN1505_c0_g1_i1.p1  ORF type:complete len:235 (+),score=44.87 TRINITY_DN1505_c0_g1_i1:98-802(+)